jgi:hypothetical protein
MVQSIFNCIDNCSFPGGLRAVPPAAKLWCDVEGTTTYRRSRIDYARQLFRLSHGRAISGATLAKETQALLEKWQARGLKPEVLAVIRIDVFNCAARSRRK